MVDRLPGLPTYYLYASLASLACVVELLVRGCIYDHGLPILVALTTMGLM